MPISHLRAPLGRAREARAMLRTLRIQNYRCFSDHTVTFHPTTVVVGTNNAGKSTIVEALHVIAAVVNRKGASFVPPPDVVGIGKFRPCIAPRIAHLDLNLETAFHRYGEPPAILTARFANSAVVTAYVHRDGVHATVEGKKGMIKGTSGFLGLRIPFIHVLPQIEPLQREEGQLTDGHVAGHSYTRLSSRHFRNQILRDPAGFADFKALSEGTWPGLRVDPVEVGRNLSLLVKDGDFVAEVGWAGHGLQMWLQTMWFLAKTPKGSIVVLDEPDVYMHPDLQRKLYRLVASRFEQNIVATHSVEIMAEADPGDILIINNRRRNSQFANTEPGVQAMIDRLGGIHNIHLARLWNARRVLLVEGDDLGYLKHLFKAACPNAELPIDAIPNWSIGGWDGWPHAIGSQTVLLNAAGDRVMTYCILDSDYHTEAEKSQRYAQATASGISLHIWERKEIENYLLAPELVARAIRPGPGRGNPTPEIVGKFLAGACEAEKETVLDAMATAILNGDRRLGLTGANKAAREALGRVWERRMLHVVSGKALISRLSAWASEEYGASLGAVSLARAIRYGEIPAEMREVLACIQDGAPFPARSSTPIG